VELLAARGLAEMHPMTGYDWSTYHISQAGRNKVEEIFSTHDQPALQYLQELVRWTQTISFQELIGSIYKQYPEYRANSIFRT
jgi:hypothetical protein